MGHINNNFAEGEEGVCVCVGGGLNLKRPASLDLGAHSCINDISFSSDERKYPSGWRRKKTQISK